MRVVVILVILVVVMLAQWPHAQSDIGAWIGMQLSK